MTFKDTDNGYQRLQDAINALPGKIELGLLGDAAARQHPNSKLTVAALGAVHEYGLGGMPERSFIRAFVDQDEFPKMAVQFAREAAAGSFSVAAFRQKFGEWCVQGMQARMDAGINPPLYPETINRKSRVGPPVPLEDTKTLRNALSFRWGP